MQMILLSIFAAQQFNSVLAYLEKPSTILYVYVYLNDPKKHSHHVVPSVKKPLSFD